MRGCSIYNVKNDDFRLLLDLMKVGYKSLVYDGGLVQRVCTFRRGASLHHIDTQLSTELHLLELRQTGRAQVKHEERTDGYCSVDDLKIRFRYN